MRARDEQCYLKWKFNSQRMTRAYAHVELDWCEVQHQYLAANFTRAFVLILVECRPLYWVHTNARKGLHRPPPRGLSLPPRLDRLGLRLRLSGLRRPWPLLGRRLSRSSLPEAGLWPHRRASGPADRGPPRSRPASACDPRRSLAFAQRGATEAEPHEDEAAGRPQRGPSREDCEPSLPLAAAAPRIPKLGRPSTGEKIGLGAGWAGRRATSRKSPTMKRNSCSVRAPAPGGGPDALSRARSRAKTVPRSWDL